MKQLVTSHPCIFGKTFQNLTHTRKKCFRVHQKRGVWTWTDSRREHACTFTLQIPLGVWSLGKCIQGIHLHTHRPLITQWLILSGSAHSIPVCWHTYYRYRIRQHLCKYTNWTSALWNRVCVFYRSKAIKMHLFSVPSVKLQPPLERTGRLVNNALIEPQTDLRRRNASVLILIM